MAEPTDKISDAEYAVMEALWRRTSNGQGATAADIAADVDPGRGWSAQTVKTLLARLLAKNIIRHEEDGRRYLYRPRVAREDYVAGESRRLVDRLFGGRIMPLVAHLAHTDQLSDADISEIQALLKALKS